MMDSYSNMVKTCGCDWMRNQKDPRGWDDRHQIDRDQWPERWHLYQRDLDIQSDMDWITEAVYQFYQKHLDKMIRSNEMLWGDFCRLRYNWNIDTETYDHYLDLDTSGYNLRDPNTVVTPTPKTVIPEPEKHFAFSTTLMVMAIELYQHEAEKKFCPYVTYAHEKLVNFVESRKQMTTESYKFFIEHCYNQFVTHEAFHTSSVSKTTAKDITGSGLTEVSTKLAGYVWVGSKTKLLHMPGGKARDVLMLDVETLDEPEGGEETEDLPSLNVKIEEVVEEEPQQALDDQQDDESSLQREVSSEFPGYSGQLERPEFPPARNAGERYGNFIMSHSVHSSRVSYNSSMVFRSYKIYSSRRIVKNVIYLQQ